MPSLKQLIGEIHRRSLWQVLSIYVAGSWGALQAIEMVVENTALPEWVIPLAIVLLLVGLPIVAATAFVQEGIHLGSESEDDDAESTPDADPAEARPKPHSHLQLPGDRSPRALLTWRNTLLAGVGAFALLGLVAAGWLVRSYLSDGDRAARASVQGEFPVAAATDSPAASGSPADSGAESGADSAAIEGSDPAIGTSDEGEAGGPGAADAGPAASRRETPRPPVARAAASEPTRDQFDRRREPVSRLRDSAARLRISDVAPVLAAAAESAWLAADRSAEAGEYGDAIEFVDSASRALQQAVDGAGPEWARRVAGVRSGLDELRAAADPTSPDFEAARSLTEDAARSEGAGDLPAAFDALRRAATLYGSARREEAPPDPAPVEPGESAPERVVEAVLARLSMALAAEDLAAVRRVWVGLSSEQASNFQTFFDSFSDVRVAYEPDWSTLDVGETEIRVGVRSTWRYVDGGRERAQPEFTQRFVLARRDGDWVVVRAN